MGSTRLCGMQNKNSLFVKNYNQSLAAVDLGTKLTEKTVASLMNVVDGTDEMIFEINQIAEA